jgi:chromosome segregation ATPase
MSHDFHDDHTNNGNHPVAGYNDDLASLIACLASSFGDEVGQAVNEKVNAVLSIEGVDIAAVQAQIATLNSLLTTNTNGDAATAQSILAAITSIGSRVTALEGSTAVADLTAVVAGLQAALATEVQNRQDADNALQSNINAIQATVDQLSQSVLAIQNSGTGDTSCDCTAITASIAEQATAIANLVAADAATASQIAALQTAIEGLTTSAAGIAAANATANAAAATAQTALANAAAATAAANAATAAAAAATAAVAELDDRNEHQHGHFVTKAEVMDINCAAIGAAFRASMRSRMGLGA